MNIHALKNKLRRLLGKDEDVNGAVITNGMENQLENSDIRQLPFYSRRRASSSTGGRKKSVMDRAPNIDHYRLEAADLAANLSRPSLKELHGEKIFSITPVDERKSDAEMATAGDKDKGSPDKFGWVQGVLVRCILNILGVMLYLRLSWVAGQAGLILGCVIVLLGTVVTTLTALSMSAICTNGEIKGGGVYFMISRSLGPEFGGSIGIIFTIANNVGAAMYIVGFSETIRDLLKENEASIVDFPSGQTDVRIISWATAVLLLCIVIAGVSFEAKAQIVLLVILSVSIVNYVIGTFISPGEEERSRGVTGYSSKTALENLTPIWRGVGFFDVFAVYFPAATGIMAGANISGDLKNPQTSIPKGTLLAILITTFLYLGGVILTGTTCLRDASGLMSDLYNGSITDCAQNLTCQFGLMNYFQVMEMESAWGPLVTAGIFAATLSSALASLVSAPKLLQAVGRDNLYPFLEFFSKGYGKADEPRRGYILVFVICMGVIAIGDLNAIAPIISNFFLASYCLVNYACFDASFSESPGFRPSFKYYNKWVSLLGAFLCIGVMFVISWSMALVTFAFIMILYVYISRRKPDVNWGSSTQAHAYRNALQKLQKLQSTEEHVKNYRAQILLLTGTPTKRPSLLDFVSNITKKNSLLICGDVILGEPSSAAATGITNLSKEIGAWFTEQKIKAFYYPIAANSLSDGAKCLLQVSGISRLKPNILLMGYKRNWQTCNAKELYDYFQTIHYGFEFNMAVGIFRTTKGFDISSAEHREIQAPKYSISEEDKDETFENRLERISEDDDDDSDFNEKTSGSASKKVSTVSNKEYIEIKLPVPQTDQILSPDLIVQNSFNEQLTMTARNFHKRIKTAVIDVWWLYDDGGLTLLIPHLLSLPKSYIEGAKLRVFSLASSKNRLESEQQNMAALLSKFRIDYKEVFVIPDISSKPDEKLLKEFNELIKPFVIRDDDINSENIYTTKTELHDLKEKIYRHLRTRELLLEYSTKSTLVILTLPVPRKGSVSAYLYMAWLEMLSRDMCPILLIRGNQQSVLTFYS